MSSISNKPWTTAQFEQHRTHMTDWVRTYMVPIIEDNETTLNVVRAPVKGGKREIVEYIAMRDIGISSPRVHVFISAWHRTADETQRKELVLHNMKVFSINNQNAARECIHCINELIALGKQVVLHLDECDHGSGERQILGKIYRHVRTIQDVLSILYSATPEEVLLSGDMYNEDNAEIMDDLATGIRIEYIPPPEFCGPSRFLNDDLVHNATPFFTMTPVPTLTEQGRQLIHDLKMSTSHGGGRNIAILRLTKKEGKMKDDKDIYKFLNNVGKFPELQDVIVIVDKGDCNTFPNARYIEWSNREFWRLMAKDIPILIVHDQTSSRSTEWACHDRIFATHDYRKTLTYATVSQAQERVNHYIGRYAGGFQPIHVFGHKPTFQLSAGIINYQQYLNCEWTMRKVNLRRAERENYSSRVYEIIDKDNHLHPEYPLPLLINDAENVLIRLGCFGEFSLSPRVRGTINRVPIFGTHWFATTSDTFQQHLQAEMINNRLILPNENRTNFNNPFQKSTRPPADMDGREYGYLRGWFVLDYETHIRTQPGWGVGLYIPRLTICYHQNTLGVAIRWHTGQFENIDRLSAYRSMYTIRL